MIIDFRAKPPVSPFTLDPVTARPGMAGVEQGMGRPQAFVLKSLDLFFKEMAESGITHCVLPGRPVPSVRSSRNNDEIAELVARYPVKFSGYAGIDASNVEQAVAEVERATKVLGFKGVILEPNIHKGVGGVPGELDPDAPHLPPMYPDAPRLYPIYAKCQELGVPIMLTLSVQMGPDLSYSSPVCVDHVAGDFPELTIIISHACWPWVTEICGVAWKRKNVYLLPGGYSVVMPGHLMYTEAANSYLQDRFLFGTNYPLRPFKDLLEAFKKLPLRPEIMEKALYKNAARLLSL